MFLTDNPRNSMIYGLIFLEHGKVNEDTQRLYIEKFAEKRGLHIDEFVSYRDNPNILCFQSGDVLVCYAWSCICKTRAFLQTFIKYVVKNKIHIFSVTSKYYVDDTLDFAQFEYVLNLCEDIRFTFLSNKSADGARKRVVNGHAPGRKPGSKNVKHALDGKEKVIWNMYNYGISMYAIAKQMRVSAPTIKRFLTSQN